MIDAKEVHNIFKDCLFKNGESHDQYIVIEGITMTIGFHPGRVDQHADDIKNILDNLSDQFKESGGGGYTFLEMPFDKDGNQWEINQMLRSCIFWDMQQGGVTILCRDICGRHSLAVYRIL